MCSITVGLGETVSETRRVDHAVSGPVLVVLVVAFALAGVGIRCAETAEHAAGAAFAPAEIRGSAFGLLATVQAIGNVAANAVAGLLYTVASPTVAFGYLAVWMLVALSVLAWAARPRLAADPLPG